MGLTKRIYFGDLTHTSRGISASTFPLGTSMVAAYIKKKFEKEFDVKLFKFPEKLCDSLEAEPPDILCLSSYSWNMELGYKLASIAKERNPNLVVIFGGPNFPVDAQEKLLFFTRYPAIDFYIELEGEQGLGLLLENLLGGDLNSLSIKKNQRVINNVNYKWEGQLVFGPASRINNLNEIPSPYLDGLLDEFFDFPLSPMIETVRGCPFKCTFCADGIDIKSNIKKFDLERIREEFEYIASRAKYSDDLIITDLNFGMYERDVDIARMIARLQEKYNWPVAVNAAPGKNKPHRLIEISSILKGSWVVGSSMQSSDLEVLKAIKRSNISQEAYNELLAYGNKAGSDSQTCTEVILALPEDTKEKHFKSLKYAIDHGAKIIRMYQAILLLGTEMASSHDREKYGYITKFRTIPGSVGVYKIFGQECVIGEIEEIIVGSFSMSFEDYLECRLMDLIVEVFYNNALFDEVHSLLRGMEISILDFLVYLKSHSEFRSDVINEIFENYLKGNAKDLYDTHEELHDYLEQDGVIEKFLSGQLGINEILVSKADLFLNLEGSSQFLVDSLKGYLKEHNKENQELFEFLDQLKRFIVLRKGEINNFSDLCCEDFDFDFKWLENKNFEINPLKIALPRKKEKYMFYYDDKQKKHILNLKNVHGKTPTGLGRLIQRVNFKKLFRQFKPVVEQKENKVLLGVD